MEAPNSEPRPIKEKQQNRFVKYLKYLTNISSDTDIDATIANITDSTEFRGINVWLLVFAILLASVGLNVNSTAVIIGAMLVSPLMGPIMGIGLSVGVSDKDLLNKSLTNLLVMVVISLVTSTVYFAVTPLSDAKSELLARTTPTIFDVFIAFFGGMSGIVAQSRKQEKTSVVSGVAIATALMPPLCTAGYGLGTGQFRYFFGAFYLFFINSFFIATATFVMVRYLKFPQHSYLNEQKRLRVKRGITALAIVVTIPSVWLAVQMVREARFNSSVISYIQSIEADSGFEGVRILSNEHSFSRKEKTLVLHIIGQELTSDQEGVLMSRLEQYGLKNTKLTIRNEGGYSVNVTTQAELLQGLIADKERQLQRRDSVINVLTLDLERERGKLGANISQVGREMQVLWPDINEVSFANAAKMRLDTKDIDTIRVVSVYWKVPQKKVDTSKMLPWLKARLSGKYDVEVEHHFK